MVIPRAPCRDRLEADTQVGALPTLLDLFPEEFVKRGVWLSILRSSLRVAFGSQSPMNVCNSILILMGYMHPRAMILCGWTFLASSERGAVWVGV